MPFPHFSVKLGIQRVTVLFEGATSFRTISVAYNHVCICELEAQLGGLKLKITFKNDLKVKVENKTVFVGVQLLIMSLKEMLADELVQYISYPL